MSIYIVNASQLGPVNSKLAKAELALAANLLNIKVVDNANDANVIILLGEGAPTDFAIAGKQVYIAKNVDEIFKDAKNVITTAKQHSKTFALNDIKSDEKITRIVAVTACPTGVAHTFMAAEAIEVEAKKRSWHCKVETRGSVGVGNELTAEEVAAADIVIAACDIDVDLSKFAGKKLYRTKTSPALKKTAQELDKAFDEATVFTPSTSSTPASSNNKKSAYQHLLTGVSYMLPMVVAGGLIIALAFAFGEFKDVPNAAGVLVNTLVGETNLSQIGGLAFSLMVPLLAGYIAYSIADRPGLAPGLVGGLLATSIGAGFLGGIVAGYFAGYFALILSKKLKLHQSLEALKPILIIPLFGTLATGLLMLFIIGTPIALVMKNLTLWLSAIGTGNAIILGGLLGGMMCTDMGGPINKVAYAFGVGLLSSQQYAPMAAIMAGGMVPPLAMSIATLLARKKFNQTERDGGKVAFVLGLCFISEGAIPFAARDPQRVLPSCIIGGTITGAMALALGSKLMTPHGGLFALAIPGVVTPVLGYILSIAVGSIVGGVIYAVLKKPE